MSELGYLSAIALGLAGAGHCLGMCGGIAVALGLGGNQSPWIGITYHAGRICSYSALGGLLGLAAGSVDIGAWTIALRYLAGILLIGMGLYIANWWRGMMILERAGAFLWQPMKRISSRWLPVRNAPQAFAIGACWGLMPCGLIYSALAWAATAQQASTSALIMFLFGLGTLPAMLATTLGAKRLQDFLRRRGLKIMIAVLLVISGVWTLYITAAHSGHSGHTSPEVDSMPAQRTHLHH